jgi:hypothetical protein
MGSRLTTGSPKQYVIQYSSALGEYPSITLILQDYPQIRVLQDSGGGIALVEMPTAVMQQIAEEFPDLTIELNIQYKKAVTR